VTWAGSNDRMRRGSYTDKEDVYQKSQPTLHLRAFKEVARKDTHLFIFKSLLQSSNIRKVALFDRRGHMFQALLKQQRKLEQSVRLSCPSSDLPVMEDGIAQT
jgi:hypothetical protein